MYSHQISDVWQVAEKVLFVFLWFWLGGNGVSSNSDNNRLPGYTQLYFALVSCHSVISQTQDNRMFKCFGCTKHTDMSNIAVNWAGWRCVSLWACVLTPVPCCKLSALRSWIALWRLKPSWRGWKGSDPGGRTSKSRGWLKRELIVVQEEVSALCCKPRHPDPSSNCLVFQSHLASFTRSVLMSMSGFKAVFCPCCLLLCWFADKYIWYLIIIRRRGKGKFKPFSRSEFE